jgi:TP901 family phage tail tape measure protein
MPVKIPVVQTGLEASIEAAAKKAGRNLKINMGGNAKSIEGLSQPLGRITGKADQFTKSMEAANARVLAFGASVGILSSVTRGFQDLIRVTIDVEKSLTSINSILNVTAKELDSFKSTIFSVAKNTEQSFGVVAEAALELSRQGLKASEVTNRLNDSLILSRLSGLGASEAVAGLTAAINSFNKSGITSSEVLNKLSAAAVSAAVSERDLIEGIKRSGSVATQAGVSFDELVGVITAVQAKTARGGAVIGNSFKTIFTRIQSIDKLRTMQNLGVEVTDASGQVLGATKLIQNLAKSLEAVPDARKLQIAEGLVGKFQVAPFLAILDDYSSKTSKAIEVTKVSQGAFSEAYNRNEAQNITLSAAINKTTVSVAQLAEALGKIGVTDNLKSMLGFFTTVVDEIQEILDGDGLGSKFAKGIVAGIGNIITGPAFAVFAAVIGKLVIDLVRFGAGSLKTFFGLNKAAKEQATLQGQIASTLLGNKTIQKKILDIENSQLSTADKRKAQVNFFTTALNEQVGIMTRMQGIAATIAPGVMTNTRKLKGRGAGGFIPNYNAIVGYGSESSDISKGVGGAPASARPVTIPNFNFGGGQKGTMVANSSEYIVPNYAGGDGSAIFNQDMAASIGLPPRARKIGAAGGYIPNFVNEDKSLVMFSGDEIEEKGRGADTVKKFYVGKTKKNDTAAYATQSAAKAAKLKPTSIQPVTVPEYKLGPKGTNKSPLSIKTIRDKLSASSTSTAMDFAKSLAPKSGIPNVSRAKIKELFNPGAFEGMSGTIFEVALSGVLSDAKFDDYASRTSTSRIDLPYDKKLFDLFGTKGAGTLGAEVKANSTLAKAASIKFYDVLFGGGVAADYKEKVPVYDKDGKQIGTEKTKLGQMLTKKQFDAKYPDGINGVKYLGIQGQLGGRVTVGGLRNLRTQQGLPNLAGGYIPNFAGGLQESIARESAAGLPINQIRINQNPKLRNSGNPMGLAVTNTRDEPTGAIPNFAKGSKGSTGNDGGGISGDFLTKLFAVQIGMSALSGILGEVTEKNKAVSASLTALNVVISAAMTAQAFGGFKSIGANLASTFSLKTAAKGTLAGRGADLMSSGIGNIGMGRSMMNVIPTPGGIATGTGMALSGGLKTAAGALLRFAGPIGAAATAGFAISKAMDLLSGRNEIASIQTKQLGENAKVASEKLASIEIPQELKARIVARSESRANTALEGLAPEREGLIENLKKEIFSFDKKGIANFTGVGLISDVFGSMGGNIEGSVDSKLEANVKEVVRQAGISGLNPQFIAEQEEIMDASRRSRGDDAQLKGEEIQNFVSSLLQQMQSLNPQKIISQVSESLSSEDLSLIREAEQLKKDAKKSGRTLGGADLSKTQEATAIIAEAFKNFQTKNPNAKNINPALLFPGVAQRASTGDTRTGAIEKIRGDLGKEQLKSAIDLAKLRATELSVEEKLLNGDKFRKDLTAVRKAELQEVVALQKIDLNTNKQIADSIKTRIDSLESVDFNEEEQASLKEKINDLTLEQLTAEGMVARLIDETLALDGKKKDEKQELIKLLNEEISRTRKLGEEERKNEKDKRKPEKAGINFSNRLSRATSVDINNIERAAIQRSIPESRVQNELNIRKAALNPNLLPLEKFRQEGLIDKAFRDEAEKKSGADLLDKTKIAVINLREEMPSLKKQFDELLGVIDKEGLESLDKVATAIQLIANGATFKVGKETDIITFEETNTVKKGEIKAQPLSAIKKAQGELTQLKAGQAENQILKEENKAIGDARAEQEKYIEGFRTFSQLLTRFTFDLKQSTEELKLDLLLAKDGASAISNIDQRLFNADSKVGGAGVTARASDQVALRGATDKITLARTSVERRAAIKNRDILAEELKIKTEVAEKQKDGVEDTKELVALREKLVALEKQRLAIGTSRAELFENEFNFTAEEIQEGLDRALVQNARTFVDTISDGLVDAIAKGQDLGDVLKQAASNFFLGEAKSNMSAAFKNITSSDALGKIFGKASGGPVTGGSGSKDDVPALLMGGEFVMKKSAVQKYGSGFMNSLNSGNIPAMARGGLFTPGTYGQGAMKGSRNLLDFATQSFTTGASDRFGSGSGFASIGLEPQSAALTMFGRRNSPAFQREQASKQKAFGLFTRQMEKEKEARERGSGFSEILKNSLLSFGASFGFKKLTDVFGPKVDISKASEGLNIKNIRSADERRNATGGYVPNVAGVDTVPSMLSGGEFVMNAAATQKIGRGNLNALNSGAGGGSGDVVGKLDELISVSDNSGETVINITVNSDGSSNSQGNGDDQQNSLATKIKDVVKQVIDDEKRLGGSLRQARA